MMSFWLAGALAIPLALSPASALGQCETWQSVGHQAPGGIYALETYGGELIAGGLFATAGGQSASNIARWDGATWQPLGAGVNNEVRALGIYEDHLIAGGSFSMAGGTAASGIARWSGTAWQALGTGINGVVRALAVYQNELIAGGEFTSAGGVNVANIARWNGSAWNSLGAGCSGAVRAVVAFNGELIATGDFTFADSQPANRIARWDGSAWQPLGLGLDGPGFALVVYDGDLVAGGSFFSAGTVNAGGVARWDGSTWSLIGSEWLTFGGLLHDVLALTEYNGDLIAGFMFDQTVGLFAPAARWDGTKWHVLGGVLTQESGDNLSVLKPYNGDLVVSGNLSATPTPLRTRLNHWRAPVSGQFSDGQNWMTGVPPSALDMGLTFSRAPSPGNYSITFDSNEFMPEACVAIWGHHPVLELNGFEWTVGQVFLGDWATGARLTVVNGVLNAGVVYVDPLADFGGNGTLVGDLYVRGKIHPGHPTGPLNVVGDYITDVVNALPTRIVETAIAPTSNGWLSISEGALLAGTLKVDLIDGAAPRLGQQYTVLTCGGALEGTFDAALLPNLGPNLVMSVQYNYSSAADFALESGSEGGPSGVVIIVTTPDGSPDFGGSQTFTLEGEPTGVTGASISGAPPTPRDLALSVAALSPTDPGNVLVLLNDGDGTSFDPLVEPVGREPSDIVAADLADSGGDDDLAVPNRGDDNVNVLFHDGGGSFTVVNVPVGDQPSAIAAGLLNGDGLVDLAVTNAGSHTVTLLFNNGNRTFTAQTPIPVGNTPSAIAIAEIDGVIVPSGGPDIVIANAMGNSMMLIRNFGPGGFGGPITHPTGQGPSSVIPADLDNDKDLDVMLGCSGGSGQVTLFINSGGGNFGSAVNLPVEGVPAQSPGALTHWDMDGDEDQDAVVVVNDDTLNEPIIRILRNDTVNGQIAFTLFDPIGAGEEPRLVAGADVTGDLADDLIAVNVQQLTLAGPPASSLAIRPNISGKGPSGPGDVNGDGVVNITDLLGVIAAWGPCPGTCSADVYPHPSGDGTINIQDLLFVIANWG